MEMTKEEIDLKNKCGLDNFTLHYISHALWTYNAVTEGNFTLKQLSPYVIKLSKIDCEKFQNDNKNILDSFYDIVKDSIIKEDAIERCGFDFWMTRNDFGLGYLEMFSYLKENMDEMDEMREALYDSAIKYGKAPLFLGRNSKIIYIG